MIYKFLKKALKGFCHLIFKIEINGKENMVNEGSCLICANHISYWDPVILIVTNPRKVHFMAKSELFKNPFLKNILKIGGVIPLNRGKADLAAVKSAMGIVKKGSVLGMFPAGTRTKNSDLKDAKSGAVLIASRTGTKIVPVGINTTYKLFSKVKINIGKPIDFAEYKVKKLEREELDNLSEKVYEEVLKLSKAG